ncbi:hypothetical protein ACFOG5_11560 [Pedobacter fastidiosus]|uniref:Uncharacterized protein n=2 Tax=Pedobacter fastidiosus TaxID=2765361 RepID=A0ABR7KYF7_9SPHI|nr:hypothetical protein [Pedobacter fastidiosus]
MVKQKNLNIMKSVAALLLVMILCSCNSKNTDNENKIIGKWVGEIIIPKTGKSVGKMYLEFTKDGDFFQKTGEGKAQVVSKLSYRIGKDKIFYKGNITGNKEFDSNYHFRDDVLVMEVGGAHIDYKRIEN